MYHAHRYSKSSWAGEPEIDPTQDYEEREEVEGWELRPKGCLEMAHGAVLRERWVVAGSSTACLVNINASSGVLRAANLGDSGFCIIRSSTCIHQTQGQTHFFNCPKQLAKLPPDSKGFADGHADSAEDADTFETKLRDGDIVILFTDGLSDNVFMTEISTICSLVSRQFAVKPRQLDDREEEAREDVLAQALADRLVDYGLMCMMNKQRASPFEKHAAREGLYFRGGKPDDITVVVALVQETI